MGSQMRRENEKLLQEYIETHMQENKEHIKNSQVIFLHAPGFNKTLFMSQSKALQHYAHKVKSIEYKSQKANFQEAKDLFTKLTEVNIIFDINNYQTVI